MGKVRSNSVIGYVLDETARTIEFTVAGAGSVTLHMDKVHAANVAHAAMFGMQQRIGDKGAIPRDVNTGLSATPLEKFNAIKGAVEFYEAGGSDWNMTRTGVVKDTTPLTLQAIAAVYQTTVEKAKVHVQSIADKKGISLADYLKVLAKTETIGKEMLVIKAAMFKAGNVDADKELAGLMGKGEEA